MLPTRSLPLTLTLVLASLILVPTGCSGDPAGTEQEESGPARPGDREDRPRADSGNNGNTDPDDAAGEPDGHETPDGGEAPDPDADSTPTDPDATVAPDAAGNTDALPDNCETLSFSLKPDSAAVANFMLVVDRSNSMNEDGRWTSTVSALREVTSTLDSFVNFGLMLFPGPGADALFGDSCATGTVLVPAAERTAGAISTQLNGRPAGGTPTALSLYAARDALVAANPSGLNFVMLATDGGPGCNSSLNASTCTCIPGATCGLNNANCLDRERTLQAVRDLFTAGIRTFVIGIPGSSGVTDLLDEMAVTGGTDNMGRHYAVTDSAELVNTLRTTTGSTVPCSYEFPEAPTSTDNIVVLIDGVEVPRDTTGNEGWNIERDRFLEFYGSACSRLRDGNPHSVDARYDCED